MSYFPSFVLFCSFSHLLKISTTHNHQITQPVLLPTTHAPIHTYTHTMGGRIHGFLGGVLFTSAVTYYTSQYIEHHQQFISSHLRTCNSTITRGILNRNDSPLVVDPVSSHTIMRGRVGLGETCKDIWNDEIITMVNWIYSIDWYSWGQGLDRSVRETLKESK